MENKGVGKFGIRIWGWPTLIFCLLQWTLMACFKLTSTDKSKYFLEPESGREVTFETILGFLIIGYLWVLVYRYSKRGEKNLSKITIGGVFFLTAMIIFGAICSLFLYFKQ